MMERRAAAIQWWQVEASVPPGVLYLNCMRCAVMLPLISRQMLAGRGREGVGKGVCVELRQSSAVASWGGAGRGCRRGPGGHLWGVKGARQQGRVLEGFEGGCRGNAGVFGVSWGGRGGGANLAVNSMHICTMAEKLCYHCGVAPPCCPMQCCLTLHIHHIACV